MERPSHQTPRVPRELWSFGRGRTVVWRRVNGSLTGSSLLARDWPRTRKRGRQPHDGDCGRALAGEHGLFSQSGATILFPLRSCVPVTFEAKYLGSKITWTPPPKAAIKFRKEKQKLRSLNYITFGVVNSPGGLNQ